jgi:hypothetical protein
MRLLRATLIVAGAALLAAPEVADGQAVYHAYPQPYPQPAPVPYPTAPSTTVVVPGGAYGYGAVASPYGVAGHSRRVSRRTSRRVSRRH